MSTHWDIKCFDCGDEAGFRINHGERQLATIIKILPLLPAAKEAIDAIDDISYQTMNWSSGHDGPSMVELCEFAQEHALHKLKLYNEYGQWDDQCHEYWECDGCGTHSKCQKLADHDGDCGKLPVGEGT
jgi:hypothetical protein